LALLAQRLQWTPTHLQPLHPSTSHHIILHLRDKRARCVHRRTLSSSRAPYCHVGAHCTLRVARQSPRSTTSEISSIVDFTPLRGPRARSARQNPISLIENAIDSVRYDRPSNSRGGGCCLGWTVKTNNGAVVIVSINDILRLCLSCEYPVWSLE